MGNGSPWRSPRPHPRARLRAEKGINFPDTALQTSATDKDVADLAAVADRVDMVALSFLRDPEDVEWLREELRRLGAGHLGIVLKIETRRPSSDCPGILLASRERRPSG